MKTIITIQHPQSEQHINGMIGSLGDWKLTEKGVLQAMNIAENLMSEINGEDYVLYSSDLIRTKQTAEIISKRMNLELHYSSLLREFDLGEANGKSKAWAKQNKICGVWPGTRDWADTTEERVFIDAETRHEVANRVVSFIDDIIKTCDKNMIIVSHAGTLSVFFAMWLGMEINMLNKCNILGKSGGVSILQEDPYGHRIISRLNDTSFLSSLQK